MSMMLLTRLKELERQMLILEARIYELEKPKEWPATEAYAKAKRLKKGPQNGI